MVKKVEHHLDNQSQIDKLKNITEKSIFIALEEKGLTYNVNFVFHQTIDNVLFNERKKHDVDLVLTSHTGEKLYVEIKGQMTYLEVNKLRYLLGLRRYFYILQLTEIDWIQPYNADDYISKFQKSKDDFKIQIEELVSFVNGDEAGEYLKQKSKERLENWINYRSNDIERWKTLR